MRGRGRSIAAVLGDALAGRPDASRARVAAAFAEACGWPLAREVALRAITREGCLIAVASSRGWADQITAFGPKIRAKVNARLGQEIATALDVRVGPLDR
jgi:Dna[CI] antecedent, DciA